ncbi:MAG: UbiA family prenyltransferase [Bacteroidia bacterium]|nr:UbiA family prenyltransferase [Bacteroidia bacterium]
MASEAIRHVMQALRVNDWWNYKIPPLFGFTFAMILIHRDPFPEGIADLGLRLLWMLGAAGFGYYTNDVFDIAEDARAGKANRAASHPVGVRLLICLVLASLALLPWTLLSFSPLALALSAAHLVLFLLYSAPPLRLKERGFFGLLLDGIYAHALPAAIVMAPYLERNEIPHLDLAFGLLVGWQLSTGLRNIYLHQWETADRDLAAGTNTWVIAKGKSNTQRVVTLILLPLEAALLAGLLGVLGWLEELNFPRELLLALVGAGCLNALKYAFFDRTNLRLPRDQMHLLNDLYEEWMPPLILIFLAIQEPAYFLVVGIYFILFQNLIRRFVKDLRQLFGKSK